LSILNINGTVPFCKFIYGTTVQRASYDACLATMMKFSHVLLWPGA